MNKVILIGRLGDDPEVNHLDSGTAVAKFSLATSERFKDRNGEKQERTEWHKVTVWGKLAEVVERFVRKGSQVMVEGKIQTSTYEKDGQKRYSTEIICQNLQMLDSRPSDNSQGDSSKDKLPF